MLIMVFRKMINKMDDPLPAYWFVWLWHGYNIPYIQMGFFNVY